MIHQSKDGQMTGNTEKERRNIFFTLLNGFPVIDACLKPIIHPFLSTFVTHFLHFVKLFVTIDIDKKEKFFILYPLLLLLKVCYTIQLKLFMTK